MGAAESKPSSATQQIFQADAPVRFSEQLTDSLQQSSTSNSVRAKELELKIQSRVQKELERLHSASLEKLSTASDKISSEPFKPSPEPPKQQIQVDETTGEISWTEKPLLNRIGDFLTGKGSSPSKGPAFQPNLESSKVQNEIEDLKRKLAGRKVVKEIDAGVKKAQEEVAKCLRLNDRRPLDCWQEVENFKAEVGRLEREFVTKSTA